MNKKNIILHKLENFAIQNKIPIWPFNEENAYLVTRIGILYNDIFTLLTSYIFNGDLCLHKSVDELDEEFNVLDFGDDELKDFKFFNLNLTKKQYYKKHVYIFSNYRQFLESAVLYYLKVSIEKNNLPFFMYLFSQILTANKTYTLALYEDMKILNIFSLFTLECLQGFFYNFTNVKIILICSFDNKNRFLAAEKTNNLFRFLNIFSFYFSPRFRAVCFKDCIKTNSYIPMFLALKIYQTNLVFPNLTLKDLNEVECISDFKKDLITFDVISEQNINKLIKKNWRFCNYE